MPDLGPAGLDVLGQPQSDLQALDFALGIFQTSSTGKSYLQSSFQVQRHIITPEDSFCWVGLTGWAHGVTSLFTLLGSFLNFLLPLVLLRKGFVLSTDVIYWVEFVLCMFFSPLFAIEEASFLPYKKSTLVCSHCLSTVTLVLALSCLSLWVPKALLLTLSLVASLPCGCNMFVSIHRGQSHCYQWPLMKLLDKPLYKHSYEN